MDYVGGELDLFATASNWKGYFASLLTEGIPADRWPNARVECSVATVEELRPDERFDSILYIDVLEHIEDDRAQLESATRHLAPGGSLIVLSPAFPSLFSKFDTALGHVRRYTAKSLASAFPSYLRRERVFYADSVGALASLANRVLLRQSMPGRAQIRTWDKGIIPISRILDPVIGRRFGRSVIAIYSQAATRSE